MKDIIVIDMETLGRVPDRPHYYKLIGKTAVPCTDADEWGRWFTSVDRAVAKTKLDGDVLVSTVFIGMDHSFGADGPPILFETMIFGGYFDGEVERYATWDEAQAGHDRAVKRVMGQA